MVLNIENQYYYKLMNLFMGFEMYKSASVFETFRSRSWAVGCLMGPDSYRFVSLGHTRGQVVSDRLWPKGKI